MQMLDDDAVEAAGLIPDLGESSPFFSGLDPLAGAVLFGRDMPERAGPMAEDQLQAGVLSAARQISMVVSSRA